MLRCSATMPRCLAPLLRYQAVWSPPIFTACVCDLCRVRVLLRLSHPRPPDRSQHGCAPDAQAVWHRSQSANSCCAELCCVVVSGGASSTSSCGLSRPYVYWIPSHTPPRHGYGCGPVDLGESHTTCGSSYSLSRLISDCECCNCFC